MISSAPRLVYRQMDSLKPSEFILCSERWLTMQIVKNHMRWQIDRTVHQLTAVVLFSILILSACSTTKHSTVSPWSSMTPAQASLKVESDQRTLRNVAGQLEHTRSEFISLNRRGGWSKRGYFVSEENNQIERLYFRLVTGHTTLWDTINSYGGPQALFTLSAKRDSI